MRLVLLGLTLLTTSPALAASICDGLGPSGPDRGTYFQEVLSLTELQQVPNQYKVTGCWSNSLYAGRTACQRKDMFGQLNGSFGSCATYSAFSAAIAIANRLGVQVPASLRYRAENLVRLYDDYGNPWDTVSPGMGSFPHILKKILQELAQTLPATHPQRSALMKYADRYQYVGIDHPDLGKLHGASTQALLRAVANNFNTSSSERLIPLEIILDGWILDRSANEYCPIRDASGYCDSVRGSDQREAHSALIVGRHFWKSACYVEIRNSWKACRNGKYGRSNNNCFSENDFAWVKEADLVLGMSGIRITQ